MPGRLVSLRGVEHKTPGPGRLSNRTLARVARDSGSIFGPDRSSPFVLHTLLRGSGVFWRAVGILENYLRNYCNII